MPTHPKFQAKCALMLWIRCIHAPAVVSAVSGMPAAARHGVVVLQAGWLLHSADSARGFESVVALCFGVSLGLSCCTDQKALFSQLKFLTCHGSGPIPVSDSGFLY